MAAPTPTAAARNSYAQDVLRNLPVQAVQLPGKNEQPLNLVPAQEPVILILPGDFPWSSG